MCPTIVKTTQILSGTEGSHRFLWDMHYQPLNVPPSFGMGAIYKNTSPSPTSPWVMPGVYIAKLTVDGKEFFQAFKVKIDPRVKTSAKDLQLQHDLSVMCYNNILKCMNKLKGLMQIVIKQKGLSKYISSFYRHSKLIAGKRMGANKSNDKSCKGYGVVIHTVLWHIKIILKLARREAEGAEAKINCIF
ncbi:MAG: hypothetical protein WDM90_05225 [Ferruginibacter sp.]